MIDQDDRLKQLFNLVETVPHDQLAEALNAQSGGVPAALDLIFALLASEFNPAKAKGKKGVFQFEVLAPDATYEYVVHVENHTCQWQRGRAEDPDIAIGVKLPDMLLMGIGKLPGAKAFMTGKLKIRGNPLFGTKLGDWFDHPPV
ncbi:SCP2 sterol-binding domain-containing protein [Salinispora oceanensis]|uniref:SCP2 sterol-binding domain-containing protein n=1 Tax=Salinispora oceanensis TaxID=1050199 RepID=UPI00037FE803|nr:SCP2 sterol-binding domain-containing protein [Salinispora oceanensis]